jgi:uncharacterized protein (UPF0264 family)
MPAIKAGAHYIGPYAVTEDELDALLAAVWQAFDDMGKEGLSVCGLAKATLRIAVEPFIIPEVDLGFGCDYTIDDALEVKKRVEGDG